MRLQLSATARAALALVTLVVLLLALPARARAQTAFTSKLQVYADDDHTTVVSPLVRAQADVDESTSISAGYVADVVTSASIDIVSQASKTTIHDLRHQVSASVSHAFDRLSVHGGYVFSTENDYLSHSFSTGASWELDEKNTTLALGGNLALNQVGRSGDRNFEKPLDNLGVNASITQVLSPRLIGQLAYELQLADGYQASPYRFVPVVSAAGATMGTPEFWVPETDPDQRIRHAFVLGANRYLGDGKALQLDYRFYFDTWAITSHTVDVRLGLDLTPHVELRLRARTYVQGGASFYRSSYAQLERYMTVDRELSPLWSETLGAKLSWKLSASVEGELKLDGFYYRYADFPLLPSRLGVNGGLGVQVVY
jgi:hypothetical protein